MRCLPFDSRMTRTESHAPGYLGSDGRDSGDTGGRRWLRSKARDTGSGRRGRSRWLERMLLQVFVRRCYPLVRTIDGEGAVPEECRRSGSRYKGGGGGEALIRADDVATLLTPTMVYCPEAAISIGLISLPLTFRVAVALAVPTCRAR